MKLTIDTTEKTIEFNESINLAELVDNVKILFPEDRWKEFKLIPNTQPMSWFPQIPHQDPIPTQPFYYTTSPTTTGG